MAKEEVKVVVKGVVNSVNGKTGDVIVEVPEVDLTDYYTKDETNELIDKVSAGDIDLTNYYTKSEVDEKIDNIEVGGETDVDLTDYYTKDETNGIIEGIRVTIPTKTSDLNNDNNFITNNTTELSNYYNKTEVNNLISSVNGVQLEVVDTLPTTDIKTNSIYLVPKISGEEQNIYNEYVYLNGNWELIGSTAVDLSNFYTKEQVDAKVPTIVYLTQAEYDALITKEENTYYFIVEA